MRVLISACVAVVLFASTAFAQPLIERVPDDAFVYVGWAGTEALGPAYHNSKLRKFLNATAFEQLMADTLPALMHKLNEEEPDKGPQIKHGETITRIVLRRPFAMYVGGMRAVDRKPDSDDPVPHLGFLVQAGPDKDALVTAVTALLKEAPQEQSKPRLIVDGDLVAVVLGYDEKAAPLAVPGKGVALSAAFTAAKRHFIANPAVTLYVDAEQAIARVGEMVQADGDEDAAAGWGRFMEASGLKGFRRMIISAGFTQDQWQSQTFLDAPAPRKGIVKLLEPQALDVGLLSRMPADATSAGIVNFDFAQLLATVREIATAVNPEAGKKVQQGLGAAGMAVGRRIEDEIFAPLGKQWGLFTSPGQGAQNIMGLIAVNKLDDEKLAKAAWGDLYFALSNTLPNMMRRQGVQVTPAADEKAIPGATVYSFRVSAWPAIPCFTFHNGYMYLGADPAVLVTAATATDSPKFTGNARVVELLKQIEAPEKLTGFRYADLAATGDDVGEQLEGLWPMLVQQAKAEGIPLPDRLLPPSKDLAGLLGPALSVSWVDEKGFYSRDRSPFPGSSSFGYLRGDELTVVGVSALGVSILLPSLNRAREAANRVKAASNLRQIGLASVLYANENKGAAPPDLGTLLKTQDLTVDVFTSPSSNTAVPADVRNAGVDKTADWVNTHSDFVFIKPAGKLNEVVADKPLAYEKLGIHGKDGTNILFADGHVEFVRTEQAIKTIKDATGAEPMKYDKPKKPAQPAKPDPSKEPGL
jgi:prepilin-type processing-associated H-X9-DG protein